MLYMSLCLLQDAVHKFTWDLKSKHCIVISNHPYGVGVPCRPFIWEYLSAEAKGAQVVRLLIHEWWNRNRSLLWHFTKFSELIPSGQKMVLLFPILSLTVSPMEQRLGLREEGLYCS